MFFEILSYKVDLGKAKSIDQIVNEDESGDLSFDCDFL